MPGIYGRQEAINYILGHRGRAPDGLAPELRADFGAIDEPPPPPPPDWPAEVRNRTAQLRELVTRAQVDRCPFGSNLSTYRASMAKIMDQDIGPIKDVADQIDGLLPKVPEPQPPPPAPEEDWSGLVDGAPGLAGDSKWLAGSTGCDIFVRRGTKVRAPHDCTVQFQGVPVPGVGTIGEMLLIYSDGRAVRCRHVQSATANREARKNEVVAVVSDPSMDRLRWPAGYPTPPDGYQHLDISLATSVGRLNPQGGAGGDVDADRHIRSHGGVPNITWVARTPGPPEGSMSTEERAAWLAWAGQKEA